MIKPGTIITARYSQISYRLEKIEPRRSGRTTVNELHFLPVAGGPGFTLDEEEFKKRTVLIFIIEKNKKN